MTAAMFFLAPAPRPVWVPVPDDIRTARLRRHTVNAAGRIARIVPVMPRSRFGAGEEAQDAPPTSPRQPLPPIPEHLIERLPPGLPPKLHFELPSIVRIGPGFDAEQPARGQLDAVALAVARRVSPVGIEVMHGLMNDADVSARKRRDKGSAAPPPRLMVLGQILAIIVQARLRLAPDNHAATAAARDAIRLLGYGRAEISSSERAKQLKQRPADFLRLRQHIENVLRTLYVEGRTVYREIKTSGSRHNEIDGNKFSPKSARPMHRHEVALCTEDRRRIDRAIDLLERSLASELPATNVTSIRPVRNERPTLTLAHVTKRAS